MPDMLPDPKPQLPLPTRRWLKPDEAAAYLGVSRGQFDYNVRCGLITPTRTVGKRLPRYDVRDLDAMMEAGKEAFGDAYRRRVGWECAPSLDTQPCKCECAKPTTTLPPPESEAQIS